MCVCPFFALVSHGLPVTNCYLAYFGPPKKATERPNLRGTMGLIHPWDSENIESLEPWRVKVDEEPLPKRDIATARIRWVQRDITWVSQERWQRKS